MSSPDRPVLVAVIDSGWDRARPHERVYPGMGFVDPGDELRLLRSDDDHDRNGHGTVCGALVMEAAPTARILPLRVFGKRLETSVDQLDASIGAAAERGAEVISMSLSTLHTAGIGALYASCERARAAGAIVIAASYRTLHQGYPAVFADVIGVRAGFVPGEWAFLYRQGLGVECAAWGHRADTIDEASGRARLSLGSSSVATARIAGILAHFKAGNPGAGLDEARDFLARNAAQTNRIAGAETTAAVPARRGR